MIKRGRNLGFTIVELLVVIIVVAVLATLVALSYGNTQIQARDTQLRDAADKFAEAIKLMQAKSGTFPAGGSGSNAVATSSGCANGQTGFQAYNYGVEMSDNAYICTLGDAAVAMGYLPSTLFTGLPINTWFGGGNQKPLTVFMVYACGTPAKNYLFYTLERATDTEQSMFNNVKTTCPGALPTDLYNKGMRAAIDLTIL